MIGIIFDTETTGLPAHPEAKLSLQPRIIDFGAILIDGNTIIDRFEFLCNPNQALDDVITKITGLTNADLDDKPPFEAFIPQMQAFMSQADYIMSHNLSFDRSMVKYDLQRFDKTLEDIMWPSLNVCSVEQLFHQYGYRMKLENLYKDFFGERVQKHRAMDDVEMLYDVVKHVGLIDILKAVK